MKRLICILFAISLTVSSQKVSFDRDPAVDFKQFHTYSWKQDKRATYPEIDEAIIAGTDQQLAEKGLQKVDASAHPDLLVTYGGERIITAESASTNDNVWRPVTGGSKVVTHSVANGMLELAVRDQKTDKVIWSARGEHRLTEIDHDKNRKIIRKILNKMFKEFPTVDK